MKRNTNDEGIMNDTSALEDVLVNEYDIGELKSFFANSFINEGDSINPLFSPLSFDEVNSKFPVEIIRSKGYSVYKVAQGGYFYVFWVNVYGSEVNKPGDGLDVYFSSYLSAPIGVEAFDALVPGISTAADVRRIDPSFELYFLDSTGLFSYSYIDEDTIMQIEYENQGRIDGYDALIVIGKEVVPRNSVYARFSAILPDDLP